MKVKVIMAIDGPEASLVGDAVVFGPVDDTEGSDKSLRDIGFWLTSWKYDGKGERTDKGRCFVPWGSALYIIELE